MLGFAAQRRLALPTRHAVTSGLFGRVLRRALDGAALTCVSFPSDHPGVEALPREANALTAPACIPGYNHYQQERGVAGLYGARMGRAKSSCSASATAAGAGERCRTSRTATTSRRVSGLGSWTRCSLLELATSLPITGAA